MLFRSQHQKTFVPVRWEVVGDKPQLLAMSLDKVIANVHRAVKEAVSVKKGDAIPYEITGGKLSDAGWNEVVRDLQSYADNQSNGFRGDGGKLNRPTQDIGLSIPAENPSYNPVQISEAKANFLNLIQGLAPPLTAREVKGATPGNVKGQILAEVNARTPETPAAIRPQDINKQTFKSGHTVKETNPLRNELAAAGAKVRELIEVTERINAGDITKVTPRPDINFKAPVTDTIRGGLLPGKESVRELSEKLNSQSNEEFSNWVQTQPGGLTGAAFRLGAGLKDAGEVAALKAGEAAALEKIAVARAAKDYDAFGSYAVRKQFFTEALEAATGSSPTKLKAIKEYLGDSYAPPFPVDGTQAFLPGKDFRAELDPIKTAAIRTKGGRIVTGSWHGEALDKLVQEVMEGTTEEKFTATINPNEPESAYDKGELTDGFVTQSGKFMTRDEAFQHANEIGQLRPEYANTDRTTLESQDFKNHKKFLPKGPVPKGVDAIDKAAVRDVNTGKIYPAGIFGTHGEALRAAELDNGVDPRDFSISTSYNDPNYEQGFVTKGGKFLNREDAMNHAVETGQIPADLREDSGQDVGGKNLESSGFQQNRKFLPGKEAEEFFHAPAEKPLDYQKIEKEQGKLQPPGELTGAAWVFPDGRELHVEEAYYHDDTATDMMDIKNPESVESPANLFQSQTGSLRVSSSNSPRYTQDYGESHLGISMSKAPTSGQVNSILKSLKQTTSDNSITGTEGTHYYDSVAIDVTGPNGDVIRGQVFQYPSERGKLARFLRNPFADEFKETPPENKFLPGAETDAALRAGLLPDPNPSEPKPDAKIRALASRVAAESGVDYNPARVYAPVNQDLAKRLADFYDKAKSDPTNPAVAASYAALADETMKQYRAIVAAGYKFEPYTKEGEPYKSSAEAIADIRDNKHLYVLPTKGNFSGDRDNPMLAKSGVEGLPTVNDVFRGVHDFFGHAKEGYQFGPRGEFNAWRAHSEMYSPEAQGALAAETLAQNSWVNFGQHLRNGEGKIPAKGEEGHVPLTERPFAEQKAVVVPNDLIEEARGQLLPKTEAGRKLEQKGYEIKSEPNETGTILNIVARKDNKQVGSISATLISPIQAHIADVSVNPNVRRQGIGEALYRELGAELQAKGVRQVDGIVVSPDALRRRAEVFPDTTATSGGKPLSVPEAESRLKRGQFISSATSKITPDIKFLPKQRFDNQGRPLTKDGLVDYEKLYKDLSAQRAEQERIELAKPSKSYTPIKSTPGGLTGWILPNQQFKSLATAYHEQFLADNSKDLNKRFGTKFSSEADTEARLQALNKGFVRIRGGYNGNGSLNMELNSRFFKNPTKKAIESFLADRADEIDSLNVSLLNDKGQVVDSGTARVHELEGQDRADALLKTIDGLRPGGQKLLPGKNPDTLPGLNLPSEEKAQQQRVKARVAASQDKFPEAIKLQYQKDAAGKFIVDEEGKPKPQTIEYSLSDSPLEAEAAKGLKGEARQRALESALGEKLVKEGKVALKNPEIEAGKKWYSTARTRLKALFGNDAKLFTELLGATSARTPVEINYRFALDAYNQFKQGKFDENIRKYREGKAKWERQDIADFFKANPGNTNPTRGQFLDWWVESNDLSPTQSNGKKFGANSRQVLRVLDGSWAEEIGGPKTPNFAGNLNGSTFEATIDVWAARTLHRLANEGNPKPWRILPPNETGVVDKDFEIGQAAYRHAAEKLGMKPDALQAVLWFAEKHLWEERGWTRGAGAEKSDFNVLLKETEPHGVGFKMKTPQQDLAFGLEPGDIVKKGKMLPKPVGKATSMEKSDYQKAVKKAGFEFRGWLDVLPNGVELKKPVPLVTVPKDAEPPDGFAFRWSTVFTQEGVDHPKGTRVVAMVAIKPDEK